MQIRGAWLISHEEREPNALLAGIIMDSFGAGWIVSLSQRNVHYQQEESSGKKEITIVRAAFLSERMGRLVSYPLEINHRDRNIPQNMHRTLGELVSDSWGHFFL